PVYGTFAGGGDFAGTATINRFEQRADKIVAIGIVRGALSRGNHSVGTALAGEVAWPVTLTNGGGLSTTSGKAPAAAHLTRISWSPDRGTNPRLERVQTTTGCGVLHISLGATSVNLAGAQVSLDPIALDISCHSGTALVDLVCAVLSFVGNVAGLVNLLNSLLGAVTGLLGGLTGGW